MSQMHHTDCQILADNLILLPMQTVSRKLLHFPYPEPHVSLQFQGYGIESHCEFKHTADYTRPAEAIEGGRGVILGLNSGILQDRPWNIYNDAGELNATHAVCLMATVRDCDTGELVGFYMCDSSSQRPDGAKLFVTLEEMDDCYTQTRDGFAVITDGAIRY